MLNCNTLACAAEVMATTQEIVERHAKNQSDPAYILLESDVKTARHLAINHGHDAVEIAVREAVEAWRDTIATNAQHIPFASRPLSERFKAAIAAVPKILRATMNQPNTPLALARLKICGQCEQWTGRTCKICGCSTSLKVRLPDEKCPLGKWLAEPAEPGN